MNSSRYFILSFLLLCLLTAACHSKGDESKSASTDSMPTIAVENRLPDTLVVGTIYSPASFFILKGDTLGYDYERICAFARDNGIAIKFHVASSMKELISFVESDKVHVAAYEIPMTARAPDR